MENKEKSPTKWIETFWSSIPNSTKTKLPVFNEKGKKKYSLELFLVIESSLTPREVNLVNFITGDCYTILVYIHKNRDDVGGKFELKQLRLSIPKLRIDRSFNEISAPFCPDSHVTSHFTGGLSWECNFICPLRSSQLNHECPTVTGALTVSKFFEGCLQDALDRCYEVFVYYRGGDVAKQLVKTSIDTLRKGEPKNSGFDTQPTGG